MTDRYYTYLGDRLTDPVYKDRICRAVLRQDGKCIRGRNGSMLVDFAGKKVVVIARRLRKISVSMDFSLPWSVKTVIVPFSFTPKIES